MLLQMNRPPQRGDGSNDGSGDVISAGMHAQLAIEFARRVFHNRDVAK
jgi:hypothetical protein